MRMILLGCLLLSVAAYAEPPELLLLNKYTSDQSIEGWLVSEKLDGVRAWWNGHELTSRQGNRFAAPAWFTEDFPAFELDGELWMGRGRFAQTLSIVSRDQPHEGWQAIGYHVFEVPNAPGGLLQRLNRLREFLADKSIPQIHIVSQTPVSGHTALMERLRTVETLGGEGLVLRNPDTDYETGRGPNALKVKSFDDADGRVIGHNPGKGRFAGLVGSLQVELEDGRQIAIGSGLSEAERRDPPPVGSIVTFKHHGYTRTGLPRFATFLRVRRLTGLEPVRE